MPETDHGVVFDDEDAHVVLSEKRCSEGASLSELNYLKLSHWLSDG